MSSWSPVWTAILLFCLVGCGEKKDESGEVELVVEIESGAVQGFEDEGVRVFLGIPFAAPPIGELRWRAPQPHPGWEGILEASTMGVPCPQIHHEDEIYLGEEDCLTLNVFTPAEATPEDALPVIVHIFGGGHIFGSTQHQTMGDMLVYDGSDVVSAGDVVVVVFNYRLGALGYLAHQALADESEDDISGNYGTLDQIRALQWVHDNISAFGGDPTRVTVSGQSSGATDVCVLMSSPRAAGLMHRGVMQSGGCGIGYLWKGQAGGAQLLDKSSCAGEEDIMGCLRALSAEEVIGEMPGVIDFTSINSGLPEGHMYMPYIDGVIIPEEPLKRIAAGRHNHMPVLLGSTSHETGKVLQSKVNSVGQFKNFLFSAYGDETGQLLFDAYPVEAYESPQEALILLSSDMRFTNEARRIAQTVAQGQEDPVYRYYFTHGTTLYGVVNMAFHTIDILYTFAGLARLTDLFEVQPEDLALMEDVVGYWTRFAADGDPNGAGGGVWEPYDVALDNSLILDNAQEMKNEIQGEQCDLWNEIFGN